MIFFNCNDNKVIEEEKFIKVYVDLLLVQDTTSSYQLPVDSISTVVFKAHGITAENYQHTIDHYNSSPEKWEDFFSKATAYVEKLKREAEH
jgi:hypothetical protein